MSNYMKDLSYNKTSFGVFEREFMGMIPKMKTLCNGITEERIREFMLILKSNPKLLECPKESIYKAFMQAVQYNLSFVENLGYISFAPRKGKLTADVGYKGFVALAHRSGKIKSIDCFHVYENEMDKFEYNGGNDKTIVHKMLPPSKRGEKVAAYGVIKYLDGSSDTHLMWIEDIHKIRDDAPGSSSPYSPWKSHPDIMEQKTVIRHWARWLDLSPEFQLAAAQDEYVDADAPTSIDKLPPIEEEPPKDTLRDTIIKIGTLCMEMAGGRDDDRNKAKEILQKITKEVIGGEGYDTVKGIRNTEEAERILSKTLQFHSAWKEAKGETQNGK